MGLSFLTREKAQTSSPHKLEVEKFKANKGKTTLKALNVPSKCKKKVVLYYYVMKQRKKENLYNGYMSFLMIVSSFLMTTRKIYAELGENRTKHLVVIAQETNLKTDEMPNCNVKSGPGFAQSSTAEI
ncbi:hypothetical protein AVEN_23158-1 [Araneus ventricosus]|uniref:Uncharacterized protein n=1 Tax=Araneus ventricosus TaxID=182803 RepID=A0A4Y2FFS4_ARAVE|nr:hypothetical protein AVEN_23158-1 [Araneus ventricosus]